MKTITKTTPKLVYDQVYHNEYCLRRARDGWLCPQPVHQKWKLPKSPHSIWVTLSTRSSREAHPIWLRRFGCIAVCWSWTKDARHEDDFLRSANRWLDRHFGAILKDGKPHKLYVSVEYLEA